jgi:hypothetical protein
MEHQKIRFVTANYAQLQGLRLIPIGLFLVLTAFDVLGVFDRQGLSAADRAQALTRMGLLAWLAIGAALAAPLYYRYRYGAVEGFDRRRRDRWITAAVLGFFVLSRVDRNLDWPVSLSLMLVSVSLFVTALNEHWVRPYYPVLAAMWLLAACWPMLGGSPPGARLALCGLGGLTLVVIGIGDHLLLSRTLATPPSPGDAPHPTTL